MKHRFNLDTAHWANRHKWRCVSGRALSIHL